jgi:hypothetical protein
MQRILSPRLVTALALAGILALVWSAMPALSQDIFGLSFRPTEASDLSARGSVDIISSGDGYVVTVDLAAASDELSLDAYEDATTFVVWVVDMDGNVINVGELDDDLTLDDAEVDGVVAKVFVTPEADADGDAPEGQRLYELTLRNVAEVEQADDDAGDEASDDEGNEDAAGDDGDEAATDDEGDDASGDEDAADDADDEDANADADADADAADDDEDGEGDEKPEELPTTGTDTRDMLVLLAVAAALLVGSISLRRARV